eukprot:5136373-Alexandrium_andersonii.AAC.1
MLEGAHKRTERSRAVPEMPFVPLYTCCWPCSDCQVIVSVRRERNVRDALGLREDVDEGPQCEDSPCFGGHTTGACGCVHVH